MSSEKQLSEIDWKTLCIYKAFKSFDTSFSCNSGFSGQEPQIVNRHWDLHGRTHTEHGKIDFLKVLLWLDAIFFSSSQEIQSSEEVDDGHL